MSRRRAPAPSPAPPTALAAGLGPPWLRWFAGAAAVGYLAAIVAIGGGQRWPRDVLPAAALHLAQVSCLFPAAARAAIEYRVEGYDCGRRAFAELEPAPYFPVRADDKESRLHRVAFFHRNDPRVMTALDDYLVGVHNEATPDAPIGGIRLLSLRHPLPPPHTRPVPRFTRAPLAQVPVDRRVEWYVTPPARVRGRCVGGAP